jgi:hypothetical protein
MHGNMPLVLSTAMRSYNLDKLIGSNYSLNVGDADETNAEANKPSNAEANKPSEANKLSGTPQPIVTNNA